MASLCSSALVPPSLPGGQILSLTALPVSNYSRDVSQPFIPNHGPVSVRNLSFCNITVAYTHPGESYTVTLTAWLPLSNWNGRLLAAGGSGWSAGGPDTSYGVLAGGVLEGFAAVTTDGGVRNPSSARWALLENGKTNNPLIKTWASTALNDMAVLGKSLARDFYGREVEYSYFSGCSQGGRQGYELAQRYPAAFDGIAAAAPAIYWPQWDPALYWPQFVMNQLEKYPLGCELDFLTSTAIAQCDSDDGVKDGILSSPDDCAFDPFAFVGQSFTCSQIGTAMNLSQEAAVVANATWSGPRSREGNFQWYGPNIGSDLSGQSWGSGPASTACANGTCRGTPFSLGYEWIQFFVLKDAAFRYGDMSAEQWDEMMGRSAREWDAVVGSGNPNLTTFRNTGGKLLTYHGQADGVIPTRGTQRYYDEVAQLTPDIANFYRYFEAPGVGHCFGGTGGIPTGSLDALIAWVENGTAPDAL